MLNLDNNNSLRIYLNLHPEYGLAARSKSLIWRDNIDGWFAEIYIDKQETVNLSLSLQRISNSLNRACRSLMGQILISYLTSYLWDSDQWNHRILELSQKSCDVIGLSFLATSWSNSTHSLCDIGITSSIIQIVLFRVISG